MSKKIIGYINGSYLKELRIKHGYTPAKIKVRDRIINLLQMGRC